MNRMKPWILAAAVAAFALSFVAVALAQPSPPSAFRGTVTSPDGPVETGLSIAAYVGETDCTNTSTEDGTYSDSAGVTSYFVTVHKASTKQGCDGEIRFEIGGRAATQTARHGGGAPVTLNLTLAPETESVTINVTVWRSVRTGNTFVSTQAPGEAWDTHNTPIDLTNLSSSGNFYQGSAIPIDVEVGGSTVTINVTVWRSVRTGNTFISTQAPGEAWDTHNTPIDLTNLSSSGRFYQGSAVAVEVDLR